MERLTPLRHKPLKNTSGDEIVARNSGFPGSGDHLFGPLELDELAELSPEERDDMALFVVETLIEALSCEGNSQECRDLAIRIRRPEHKCSQIGEDEEPVRHHQ